MNLLKAYRLRHGLTQDEVVEEIRQRAVARGDIIPGLDRVALSKHENDIKAPGPYYRSLYCEIYGATPAQLGFRLALPGEEDDVDRREFLTGAAGFVASAALAPVAPSRRLGSTDLAGLRQAVTRLYRLDEQHGGASAAYPLTIRTFKRLHGLVDRASYDHKTGQDLRELVGLTAEHAGWMAFDADRQQDARHWWLEAMHWGRLADADSVGVVALVSMAAQATDRGRSREAVDLALAARRAAKHAATPRLTSMLLVREAVGHAGGRDAPSAHAALGRAQSLVDRPRHDDDPSWMYFYGPADFASHEREVALTLNDLPAAEDAAREALTLNDAVAFPRTHTLYLIRLADVLVRRREIDEAVAFAARARVAAADLDSGRVTAGLRAVARGLAPYRDEPGVREFLAVA